MKARVLLVVALSAASAVVATACGVPTDEEVRRVPAEDLPFGLGAPEPTTTTATTTTIAARPTEALNVFLVSEGGLVSVTREVARPVGLPDALEALVDGPTAEETEGGLRSAIAGPDVLRSVQLARGTATVEIGPEFGAISGTEQILALAQAVFTITGRPGVGQVRFTLEGSPVEIPRGDGSLTVEPVTREDYAQVEQRGAGRQA